MRLVARDKGARRGKCWPIELRTGCKREQLFIVCLRGRRVAKCLGRLGRAEIAVEAVRLLG